MVIVAAILAAIICYKRPAMLFEIGAVMAAPGLLNFFPPAFGGLFWRRATKEGAMVGFLVGCLVVLYFDWYLKNPMGTIYALVANTVLFLVVSLLTRPESKEHLGKVFAPVTMKSPPTTFLEREPPPITPLTPESGSPVFFRYQPMARVPVHARTEPDQRGKSVFLGAAREGWFRLGKADNRKRPGDAKVAAVGSPDRGRARCLRSLSCPGADPASHRPLAPCAGPGCPAGPIFVGCGHGRREALAL